MAEGPLLSLVTADFVKPSCTVLQLPENPNKGKRIKETTISYLLKNGLRSQINGNHPVDFVNT